MLIVLCKLIGMRHPHFKVLNSDTVRMIIQLLSKIKSQLSITLYIVAVFPLLFVCRSVRLDYQRTISWSTVTKTLQSALPFPSPGRHQKSPGRCTGSLALDPPLSKTKRRSKHENGLAGAVCGIYADKL
jgi:hypothetical protein